MEEKEDQGSPGGESRPPELCRVSECWRSRRDVSVADGGMQYPGSRREDAGRVDVEKSRCRRDTKVRPGKVLPRLSLAILTTARQSVTTNGSA